MPVKTLLAALALPALPGLACGQCAWGSADEATMSCVEGTTWDAVARTCVATATG